MKRSLVICMLVAFIAVGYAGFVHAAGDQPFLIVPGKKVGFFVIGKPIQKEKSVKLFGMPASVTPPAPGKSGKDTGNYYWKGQVNVKVNDGKGDDNVFQIFVINKKFKTAKGIGVGSSFAALKKAYPGGKKAEGMDVDYTWDLPGISFGIFENKVSFIGVHPVSGY